MTANAALKANYTKWLNIGFLLAILIHVVAFALWPEYVPSTYRPRVRIPEWIEIPPDIEIPPPPKEIPPPEIPVEIQASDDVSPEETIAPTSINPRDLPPVAHPPPPDPQVFLSFDTYPEMIRSANPRYPELARKAEVEGRVVVLVTIDETGRVIDAWIAESEAAILNDAAIEAAYKFKFTPARQRDIPVKATISLTFRFLLAD